jgi:hypothetical protein
MFEFFQRLRDFCFRRDDLRDTQKRERVSGTEGSLSREFPEEWAKYEEYRRNWAIAGIYFLKFPTFEEFLKGKELAVKPEVQDFLNGAGLDKSTE